MTQPLTPPTNNAKNFDDLDDLEEWFEDEQESAQEKRELFLEKNQALKSTIETTEITNKLYEDILVVWKQYAYLPVDIQTMAEMMRALNALRIKNIQLLVFPDPNPNVPRLRFTYRGTTYIWSESCMILEG